MTESNERDSVSDRPETEVRPRQKPFLRRAAISAITGILAIAVVQYFAPDYDYQIAFILCVLIAIISLGLTLFFLERAAWRVGHPWIVPLATLAIAVLLVSLVRIRTLSGEMIPQLEWRFTSRDVPELQRSVVQSPAITDQADRSEMDPAAASDEPTGDDDLAGWTQFLGEHRTGIVADRKFAIPQSPSDVETLWNIGIGAGWSSFAISGEYAVTLEQRDERECVTAYRISDGELLWIVDHEAVHTHPLGETGPRSTPTIDDGRVYAQGATGMLWCLDLASGDVIWQVDLLELADWDQAESESAITWGRSGSPLLVDGLCVVPFGADSDRDGRSLVALSAEDGEVRWTAGDDQISYASPQLLTLAGQRQIVIVNEKTISGHAIDSGAQLWQTKWSGQSNGAANCSAVVPAGENRFLIGKGYGGGSALIEVQRSESGDGFVAEDVWHSSRVLKTKFNHAVTRDGVAYALSNGALQAIELESGRRLWEQSRRSRSGQGQVILAGDTLIVQEEMGDILLVAADPSEYREQLRLPALDHKTWNVPSLVGDVLLIRNSVQAMALQLPAQ
ncbi:outer membrane protein assembly factor BamB family protein [Allorhodopirellula solitaria]|nr:PQQ-binding-like beta-propeller repeat protein [Allorhodopirellula solitaria]